MKFSTRIDTDMTAECLFDRVGDFEAFERTLIGRGASVKRIDPAQDPGITMGWKIGFDWRGRARRLLLVVSRFDRPEQIVMAGSSEALDIWLKLTFVALSRSRSRLIFETELKPRNMRARLMIQTAKLGKAQLDRRYARRIEEYVRSVTGEAA
ncbi:hypothetical protein KY389_09680 [Paracoccus bogoriensis]|nr:hypothetical protein [Paracoccus bogoriensis]